jgi:hypothetical protein
MKFLDLNSFLGELACPDLKVLNLRSIELTPHCYILNSGALLSREE